MGQMMGQMMGGMPGGGGGQAPVEWADGVGGLAGLERSKKVVIQQQQDMMELMTRQDQPNKYIIKNDDEKQLFFLEETNCYSSARERAFDVRAKDAVGSEIFKITRKYRGCCEYCGNCCACCDGCKSDAEFHMQGRQLGTITQTNSIRGSRFTLTKGDGEGKELYKFQVTPSCCGPGCYYSIEACEGSGSGHIQRLNQGDFGIGKGRNAYELVFPEGATLEDKVMIIGSNILFDYRFHYLVVHTHQGRRGRRRR